MLLVGQPISRTWRIVLGILSVSILIGLYSYLANARQQRKRDEAATKLPPIQQQLEDIDQQIEAARGRSSDAEVSIPGDTQTNAAIEKLEARRERLERQVEQVQIDFDVKGTAPSASPDKDGFVVWHITLPAGGQEKVTMKYTLTKHRDVVGLP